MWWTQKRLQWIPPTAVFGITVALGLMLVVRGTSADDAAEDPKTMDEGVVCQVLRAGEGKSPFAARSCCRSMRTPLGA